MVFIATFSFVTKFELLRHISQIFLNFVSRFVTKGLHWARYYALRILCLHICSHRSSNFKVVFRFWRWNLHLLEFRLQNFTIITENWKQFQNSFILFLLWIVIKICSGLVLDNVLLWGGGLINNLAANSNERFNYIINQFAPFVTARGIFRFELRSTADQFGGSRTRRVECSFFDDIGRTVPAAR